jgi:hypothetical protein
MVVGVNGTRIARAITTLEHIMGFLDVGLHILDRVKTGHCTIYRDLVYYQSACRLGLHITLNEPDDAQSTLYIIYYV